MHTSIRGPVVLRSHWKQTWWVEFFSALSCLVPEVRHATYGMPAANTSTPNVVPPNVTITYVCDAGYAFPNNSANNTVDSITCMGNNTWNNPIPKCEGKSMGLLPDTQNCRLRMRRECRECFPRHRRQGKTLISDPGMHHGTCVRHVPWCMSESLTRGGGENVPGIPGACANRSFTCLARGPWGDRVHPINYALVLLCVLVLWLRHRRLVDDSCNVFIPNSFLALGDLGQSYGCQGAVIQPWRIWVNYWLAPSCDYASIPQQTVKCMHISGDVL